MVRLQQKEERGEREGSHSSAQVVEELCTIQRQKCAKGSGKERQESTEIPTKNWRWERGLFNQLFNMMKEQCPKYAESWNKEKYRGKQNFKTRRLFVYIEGNQQAKKTEDGQQWIIRNLAESNFNGQHGDSHISGMYYRGEIEEAEPLANNTSHESKMKRERDAQGSSNYFSNTRETKLFFF